MIPFIIGGLATAVAAYKLFSNDDTVSNNETPSTEREAENQAKKEARDAEMAASKKVIIQNCKEQLEYLYQSHSDFISSNENFKKIKIEYKDINFSLLSNPTRNFPEFQFEKNIFTDLINEKLIEKLPNLNAFLETAVKPTDLALVQHLLILVKDTTLSSGYTDKKTDIENIKNQIDEIKRYKENLLKNNFQLEPLL
jgi:hypothetical protein